MKNLIIRDQLHEISSKVLSANNLVDALRNNPGSREVVIEALLRIWPKVYFEVNKSIDLIRNEVPTPTEGSNETR